MGLIAERASTSAFVDGAASQGGVSLATPLAVTLGA
jgi:hypothetical protein